VDDKFCFYVVEINSRAKHYGAILEKKDTPILKDLTMHQTLRGCLVPTRVSLTAGNRAVTGLTAGYSNINTAVTSLNLNKFKK
jgi:hypothetical protein